MTEISKGLKHWLDALSVQLSPASRRLLMRKIVFGLRNRARNRISQQLDPDGHKFVPRKRNQIKSIRKGAMFQKLKTRINVDYDADSAALGFAGVIGEKMKTHQFGLSEKPYAKARPYRYPRRELLGFSADDLQWIEDQIENHFKPHTE